MIRQLFYRLAPDRHVEVPLTRTGADRFVPWLIAPMAYLATLSLIAAMASSVLVDSWENGLTGALTVQIRAIDENDRGPADMSVSIGQALAILRDWPGVAAATPIDPPEVGRLLEPWLGDDLPLDQLPLPALIDVTLSGDPAVDVAALDAAPSAEVPGAAIDDHATWLADMRAVANTVTLISGILVVLITVSAVATLVFVTRAGLAIHGHVIALLHIIGATDDYVARQFEWYAFALALRGAVIGFVLALATLFVFDRAVAGGPADQLPDIGLSAAQWASLVLVPVVSTLLAAVTARVTVLAELTRMP